MAITNSTRRLGSQRKLVTLVSLDIPHLENRIVGLRSALGIDIETRGMSRGLLRLFGGSVIRCDFQRLYR